MAKILDHIILRLYWYRWYLVKIYN